MSWPTARRYPRSLAEAFPHEHAYAVEIYRRPRVQWWLGVALAIAIGVALGAVLVDFVTPDPNQPAAPSVATTTGDAAR
jgi:hypothetical protein